MKLDCVRIVFRAVCFSTLVMLMSSTSQAQEWYEQLVPGMTRTRIHQLAGKPASTDKSSDRYNYKEGQLALEYNADVLVSCELHHSNGSRNSYFFTWGGDLLPTHTKARQKYLNSRSFVILPKFNGPKIRASGVNGIGYQVEDSFIVIDPIIPFLGGSGYYADKAAKVTLINNDGTEKVLYCAFDHWSKLKPPQLNIEKVQVRTQKLRFLGQSVLGKPVESVLGQEDSRMGSGVDYSLFYITDALVVTRNTTAPKKSVDLTDRLIQEVLTGDTRSRDTQEIANISFLRPGKKSIRMAEWIKGASSSPVVTPRKPKGDER